MSLSGSSISVFGNWLVSTREAMLSSPEEIRNDAVLNTYVISDMLSGSSTRKTVRGGRYISERIKLNDMGNFKSFTPGAELNTTRPQTMYTIDFAWRHYRNPVPFTAHEIDFNQGDMLAKFKDFRMQIEIELKSDHYTGIENALWKQPNSATMEGVSIKDGDMYSIPVFITENVTSPTTTGYRPPGWGSSGGIASLSPNTYANWRNQNETFDSTAVDDPVNGLFAAFDKILIDIEFKPPPQLTGVQDNDLLDKVICYTNFDGAAICARLLRASNNFTRQGPQDPNYHGPLIHGIPIKPISVLNTVQLDETAGAYNNVAYPTGKPRFYFCNLKYLYTVFHPLHFMKVTQESGAAKYPGTTVFIMDSSAQLVCTSRRRQGMVAPA